MTDREIAVATFKAVAALHYALVGKPLSISVETDAGSFTIVEPMTAEQGQPSVLAGSQPMPSPSPV